MSDKEIERINNATQNIHDSTTIVRSSSFEEKIISPSSLRKMSAVHDIPPLLRLDIPQNPLPSNSVDVEPDSPRKMSAIFDITEYALTKSPPESPLPLQGTIELASAVVNSESQPEDQQDSELQSPGSDDLSPGSSYSSFSSRRHRSSESCESSASETESDYSDVFTENVSVLYVMVNSIIIL